jgi:YD repeat-containing protein
MNLKFSYYSNFDNSAKVINDCRLIEEKINGITSALYSYDSIGRLVQQKNLQEGFSIDYKYNAEGYLVSTIDNSPIGYKVDYFYANGLLVKSIKTYFSESTPLITEYAYNSNGELNQIKETLYSTTITTFRNKVAVKIVNDYKKFLVGPSGLILEILSNTGNSIIYTYDKNEQLIIQETLDQNKISNSKKQYFYSPIKKTEIVPSLFKGFPSYKNPLGSQTHLVEKIVNYSEYQSNKTLIKSLEEDRSFKTDIQGKLISEEITIGTLSKTKHYVYQHCN